ncbi:MAG: hypothetical protein J6U17_01350 [Kiritimatiellae bacterium]|nr:hypothetical protein [Kiritimatiellia bacterium]
MKIRDLKWRELLFLLQSSFFIANLNAGIDDAVLRFSTPGPEHYADMRMVVDGECYALVWSPVGTSFSGFNADGTAVSPSDRVVLAAPLAKGGRCPEVLFQVPAATFAELKGGEWSVCLVDTRNARGVPVGALENIPQRVNRWGVVKSGVVLESANSTGTTASSARLRAAASASTQRGTGTMAGILSEVPPGAASPTITAIDVADGKVRLEVSDTVPYLTYTLSSGETPEDMEEDASAELIDGKAGGAIEIRARETDGNRFFKVIRAE